MRVYRGIPPHDVVVVDRGETRDLRHVVKHSPTGFSWGYGGSGPAELARCILIDLLGDDVVCEACNGRGRRSRRSCSRCWGEGYLIPPSAYQAFKWGVVAKLPLGAPWELHEEQIREWIASYPGPVAEAMS